MHKPGAEGNPDAQGQMHRSGATRPRQGDTVDADFEVIDDEEEKNNLKLQTF